MRLLQATLEAIAEHARLAAPAECCGVLVGRMGEVIESVASANLAPDPIHGFLLDPATHIEARRRARERGLTVVGFYHSHPDSAPTPSRRDVEGATYADHVYVIVRPTPSVCEARAFEWRDGRFEEMEVVVD